VIFGGSERVYTKRFHTQHAGGYQGIIIAQTHQTIGSIEPSDREQRAFSDVARCQGWTVVLLAQTDRSELYGPLINSPEFLFWQQSRQGQLPATRPENASI
jgi:hypothetical protein